MHGSTKKLSGDLIKDGLSEDGKQKYLMIRRIFITVGVRELHLLMMKEKKMVGTKEHGKSNPMEAGLPDSPRTPCDIIGPIG